MNWQDAQDLAEANLDSLRIDLRQIDFFSYWTDDALAELARMGVEMGLDRRRLMQLVVWAGHRWLVEHQDEFRDVISAANGVALHLARPYDLPF